MTSTETTFTVDEIHGGIVEIRVLHSYGPDGWCVRIDSAAEGMGNTAGWLTPAAARALAAHLTELADEADVRNL